jgi:cytochrome c-type biogenesis protein CcmF
MAPVGRTLLILGLVVAGYGIVASIYGVRTGRREWVVSGRRAVYALAGLMTIAWVILEAAFLRSDFTFNVVAQHSSTTTPTFYKLAAPWSSQEGSLLLWVWLLSLWSSLVLFLTRKRVQEIAPYATAVLLGFAAFFTSLAVFFANPFTTTSTPPAEGAGLDPLLLHPSMMIHPPMLYSGYTLMTIPFAFAIGALISGRLGSEWISVTRKFALAAWLFLGIGIVLGARWSYTELGWGGYWAWDPVENAALMPWLCITAFIHSIMIQEKRGMLKVWNVSLVLGGGTLAIFGTFLVRSGVLDSIHAFGGSTLGVPFVVLLAVMFTGAFGLVVWRRQLLASEARLDSLLSREAAFLFQNLVLVAMVLVIFWITLFPLISQALTGTKIAVGPTAFNPFVVPLALVLVALSGIGPLIAWRRVTAANLRRSFTVPVLAGVICGVLLAIEGVDSRPFALAMFALGAFVLLAVAQELARGAAARRGITGEAPPLALLRVVGRNRRRYGGYIVHAGVAVLLIGVAASSSFQHSRQVTLAPGQSAVLDGYKIRYVRPTEQPVTVSSGSLRYIAFGAVLNVSEGGHHVVTLQTTRRFYPATATPGVGPISIAFLGEADSQVGLQAGLTRDIWTVINAQLTPLGSLISKGDRIFENLMRSLTPAQAALPAYKRWIQTREAIAIEGLAARWVTHPWPSTFLFIIDPLVSWLWIGAIIVALGGLLALWPRSGPPRRRRGAEADLEGPSRRVPEPVLELVASVATRFARG